MSLTLFDRVCELSVQPVGSTEAIVFGESLRIVFECTKTKSADPNTGSVSIYNLSTATIEAISSVDALVVLKAGYKNSYGLEVLFSGTVLRARTTSDGVDRMTTLELVDGGVSIRDSKGSFSFSPNTTLRTVLSAVLGSISLPIMAGAGVENAPDYTYKNGATFQGSSSLIVERLSREFGFSYSVQNGEQSIRKNGEQTVGDVVIVSPSNGLIGTPESCKDTVDKKSNKKGDNEGQSGYRFKILLMPSLLPEEYIQVDSIATGTGFSYKVVEVSHKGDTHGSDWTTEVKVAV